MNKFDVHDLLKVILIVLVSLLAWVARGIHTQQADISSRLLIVEKNQIRIMTVMGIDPYSSNPQNRQFSSSLSQ